MDDAAREFLRDFRRQMRATALLRWGFVVAMLGGLVAYYLLDAAARPWVMVGMFVLAAGWIMLGVRGMRLVRQTRLGAALLEAGQIEEAQKHFSKALRGFTPLRSVKILTCHQLAVAAHVRRSYRAAVAICRELLAHRLGTMSSIAAGARLILADSLLMLDDVSAAAAVIEAINPADLSLANRVTLLPVELRYQLAIGRNAEAIEALPEKVRLAELLDAQEAALAHALLAEACRRNKLDAQGDYLLQRAALLGDLDDVLARHGDLLGHLKNDVAPKEPPEPADS